VRDAVALCGGRITVRSEQGQGTRFGVTFPPVPSAAELLTG
jgi:signal transduction histidine kinase